MNNLLDTFEKKQIDNLTGKKRIPAFRPGDTLKITLQIKEGDKVRLQNFEGVCISRKNNSVNSKFTVRKLSHGEGVERVFPLFSPIIEKIEVIRKGDVKRAKLYYLRNRTGKSARISDKDRGDEVDQFELIDQNIVEDALEKENNNSENQVAENNTTEESEALIKEDKSQISETANDEAEKKSDEKQS